jgi:hypothetical protein
MLCLKSGSSFERTGATRWAVGVIVASCPAVIEIRGNGDNKCPIVSWSCFWNAAFSNRSSVPVTDLLCPSFGGDDHLCKSADYQYLKELQKAKIFKRFTLYLKTQRIWPSLAICFSYYHHILAGNSGRIQLVTKGRNGVNGRYNIRAFFLEAMRRSDGSESSRSTQRTD